MIFLLWLPVADIGVHDTYEAVIWNIYRTKDGKQHTQLLVCTFTRLGLRVEDWRALSKPPIVKKRGRQLRVWFVDDRNRVLRCIHCKTYNELRSGFDYELHNRKTYPLDHRRPLTRP